MTVSRLHLSFSSESDTASAARSLAVELNAGDVVLLEGPVGAGKTHFARHLILSILDTPEDVPSPTFTLVQTYDTTRGHLWHADLYRLSSPYEIEELGLLEAFDTAICLIEWPDRLGDLVPESALHLEFSDGPDENSRMLEATWNGPQWDEKLRGWRK